MADHVVVVGGGLAGITTALRCADAGLRVTLLEARPRLGGLATSFRRGGLVIDNGQHVFLRCCTSYRALLERLGVADQVRLQDRLDIPVRAPGQRTGRLRRSRLPAPLHMAGALLTHRPLSLAERVRLVPAALALRRVDRDAPATDAQSFGGWLAAHGQSPRAVEALWDLVGIATLNARAGDASLALAATVFQLGLLTAADAGGSGWAGVPLGQLHDVAAAHALTAAGVEVRTSAKVRELTACDAGWRVLADPRQGHSGQGDVIMADHLVSAVPPAAAERLLPEGALDLPAGWAEALGSAPIVNVHVVYDRPVLDEPFLAGVDTPVQWVFDRTASYGLHAVHPAPAQYVAVSISAAQDERGEPVEALRARMLPALAALLPAARSARVLDFFVTREPHATFAPAPGSGALRPGPRTSLPGLVVAGSWTGTGWPATMESAVRSGDAAAAAVVAASRSGRPVVAA